MKRYLLCALLMYSCAKERPVMDDYSQIDRTYSDQVTRLTLILDFDGGKVNSKDWPVDSVSGAGLTHKEQNQVFDSVVQYFRAFGVTITTHENQPLFTTPMKLQQRIIVTEDYQFYKAVGGVSVQNGLTMDAPPCFVFSSQLGHQPILIAQAIAHEVGHCLGLHHQQSRIALMGEQVSDYKQWVSGYTTEGKWQDDTTIIQTMLNLKP